MLFLILYNQHHFVCGKFSVNWLRGDSKREVLDNQWSFQLNCIVVYLLNTFSSETSYRLSHQKVFPTEFLISSSKSICWRRLFYFNNMCWVESALLKSTLQSLLHKAQFHNQANLREELYSIEHFHNWSLYLSYSFQNGLYILVLRMKTGFCFVLFSHFNTKCSSRVMYCSHN